MTGASSVRDRPKIRRISDELWKAYSPTTIADARVADSVIGKAEAHRLAKRISDAIAVLEAADNIQTDSEALNRLGLMLLADEQYDAAADTFDRSVDLYAHHLAKTLSNRAVLAIYLRDWPSAIRDAEKATRISPTTAHGWVNLLFSLGRAQKDEAFRETLDRMVVEYPKWNEDTVLISRLREDALSALSHNEQLRADFRALVET